MITQLFQNDRSSVLMGHLCRLRDVWQHNDSFLSWMFVYQREIMKRQKIHIETPVILNFLCDEMPPVLTGIIYDYAISEDDRVIIFKKAMRRYSFPYIPYSIEEMYEILGIFHYIYE